MGKIQEIARAFHGKLSVFKKHPPIGDSVGFGDFLATRASYISQKKLYEYLKTRMGMQYPKMFEDEVFVRSINVAKWGVYAACLSDLAIYMAANLHLENQDKSVPSEMARYWHHFVIDERFDNDEFDGDRAKLKKEFETRLKDIDWADAAEFEGAFQKSPKALIRLAPIADELKKYDSFYVQNSIRFAWQSIRREYVKLLDRDAVLADWEIYRTDMKV